ncbi:RHS repeat-associated core domain-containing protein [Stieleria mannarensis]|uniref:RHS repeat-associated core domain-containing protein n=1 Tax=Stieleria mannarensis TaxID=2755585 RepID=UPI0015FF61A3|nr:RHS repeat-associated core domain-containing protein [Rhodopirellula sp. JC639]
MVALKTIDYTFGHDEIAQRIVTDDGQGTTDETHVFGHDGHGSVRVLYDLAATAATIAQVFTFAPYGEIIALHGPTANSLSPTSRLSSLGYSGEHFDAKAQQQYLRARFYDPANGRFNRLDPFAGNMQDPQSLHKYAYVHGDPIQGVDPTGLEVEPYDEFDFLTPGGKGMSAHRHFSHWVERRYGKTNVGKTIGTLVPGMFSPGDHRRGLKPDYVDTSMQRYYELKPVTHSNSVPLQTLDYLDQMPEYDTHLPPKDYFRGLSASVIPHQTGGYFKTKQRGRGLN